MSYDIQMDIPLTAPHVTTGGSCRWKAINKVGRHVGLDFYDLLIEGVSAQSYDEAMDLVLESLEAQMAAVHGWQSFIPRSARIEVVSNTNSVVTIVMRCVAMSFMRDMIALASTALRDFNCGGMVAPFLMSCLTLRSHSSSCFWHALTLVNVVS